MVTSFKASRGVGRGGDRSTRFRAAVAAMPLVALATTGIANADTTPPDAGATDGGGLATNAVCGQRPIEPRDALGP